MTSGLGLCVCAEGGVLWFAGTVPRTIQGREWEDETNRKLDAWPREAAGPVVMNPISRQNYHKA